MGTGIYGFSFIMLSAFSTLYHGIQQTQVNRVVEIFDNISIYFLIAGTSTFFLLICFNDAFAITLLSVLWALTLLGAVFKVFTSRFEIF